MKHFDLNKFNKQELEIINDFIKTYNSNYNGNLEKFIENPKIYKTVKSDVSESEILHLFNELNYENKIIFDPLYKFHKNADSYMLFLSLCEIKNGGCVFVIPDKELSKMGDENKNKYYPYYMHAKLMFDCVSIYNCIKYEDFKNKKIENEMKYILLCPYLFIINDNKIENIVPINLNDSVTHSSDLKIEVSQDIPYTDSKEFNEFIFHLWNQMMGQNIDLEDDEIDSNEMDTED